MCYLILRQGPEGRRLNVSPARKGWVLEAKPERRRRGTLPRPTPNLISPYPLVANLIQ